LLLPCFALAYGAGHAQTTLTYAHLPGSTGGNRANGINLRGDIVGAYLDSSGADHGFMATR